MKKSYTISLNGQKAVNIGYAIQQNHCYHVINDNNRFVGQLEVVIDEEGYYNGFPNKWVAVSYINRNDIKKVIDILGNIGFSGFPAIISEETEVDCYAKATDLCCIYI